MKPSVEREIPRVEVRVPLGMTGATCVFVSLSPLPPPCLATTEVRTVRAGSSMAIFAVGLPSLGMLAHKLPLRSIDRLTSSAL